MFLTNGDKNPLFELMASSDSKITFADFSKESVISSAKSFSELISFIISSGFSSKAGFSIVVSFSTSTSSVSIMAIV